MQLPEIDYPDLATLNKDLAKSLRSLHTPTLDSHAHRIDHCVHARTRPDDHSQYCRSKFCLECRRWRALDERGVLLDLLDTTLSTEPAPLMFFQTLTLMDCTPAEVKARAAALVKGFAKLRRKLPHHQGWARVIETKTADFDDEAENVHLHFVALFPPGQEEKVRSMDWDSLWSECAGDLARSTDPDATFAREPAAVLAYMTKGFDWDYAQDGRIGKEDPRRYMQRVENGHARFSGGGLLRLRPFTRMDRLTGLDLAYSPTEQSTARNRARHPGSSTVVADIPIEGGE